MTIKFNKNEWVVLQHGLGSRDATSSWCTRLCLACPATSALSLWGRLVLPLFLLQALSFLLYLLGMSNCQWVFYFSPWYVHLSVMLSSRPSSLQYFLALPLFLPPFSPFSLWPPSFSPFDSSFPLGSNSIPALDSHILIDIGAVWGRQLVCLKGEVRESKNVTV